MSLFTLLQLRRCVSTIIAFLADEAKAVMLLALVFAFPFTTAVADENVGIGTTTPDSSAVLDISIESLSRPRGVLFPRLTEAQRNAIVLPARGLVIYNTTSGRLETNNGTFTAPVWREFLVLGSPSGGDWSLFGNNNIDPATQFLGTINEAPLIIKTRNQERLRIDSNGFVGIGTLRPLSLFSVGSNSEFRVDSNGFVYTERGINLSGSRARLELNGDPGVAGDVLVSGGNSAAPVYTKRLDSLYISRLNSAVITADSIRARVILDSVRVIGPINSKDLSVSGNLNLTGTNSQFVTGGSGGRAGQVLVSGGAAAAPSWTSTVDSLGVNNLSSRSIRNTGGITTDSLRSSYVQSDSITNSRWISSDSISTNKLRSTGVANLNDVTADSIASRQ
ncbi:MAG: hypothetical protein ACK54V_07560, partial [Candidatus Kapaibacterium sp.]